MIKFQELEQKKVGVLCVHVVLYLDHTSEDEAQG